jgi:hypothetical protein
MKRESAPRRLHMGCGERLIARIAPVAAVSAVKLPSGNPPKGAEQRMGKGKR